ALCVRSPPALYVRRRRGPACRLQPVERPPLVRVASRRVVLDVLFPLFLERSRPPARPFARPHFVPSQRPRALAASPPPRPPDAMLRLALVWLPPAPDGRGPPLPCSPLPPDAPRCRLRES